MKNFFVIIIFAFLVSPTIAQDETDQATVRCYYHFFQKEKAGDKNITFRDTLTLDIGSQMSRYYDERKIQRDTDFSAIVADYNPNTIKSITVLQNVNPDLFDYSLGDTYRNNTFDGVSEQIFKDRKNGNIIMLNTVGFERYKGTDPVGTLNWNIESDTAVFLDYPCQKASLQFRGRNYEAWFAPQIPINEGPWKFFGLPGLILKVKDADGMFDIECIGLENLDTPYTIEIPKGKYVECNRKDYNKVVNKKDNSQMINNNAGNITIASVSVGPSFQAMELE